MNEKMEMGCKCSLCRKVVYLEATIAQWNEQRIAYLWYLWRMF